MSVPAKQDQQDQQQGSSAADFRKQLESRLNTFADALPEHITVQRFKSVVSWAVMADPLLLSADRVSLFESCLAAANDGLMPDKKEGALVIYNTKLPKENKKDPDVWIKKVQWLPMVRGIITKIYNTGKVKNVSLDLVYGGDHWRYWKDDEGEHYEHIPAEAQNRSIIRLIYASVVMLPEHGGGVFVERLNPDDIEKVRSKSKAKDSGPWVDWWEEMAKKTALKRLAKRLPIAREIQQVLDRDNNLYDLDARPAAIAGPREPRKSLTSSLDDLAAGGVPMTSNPRETENVDQDTGEVLGSQQTTQQNTTSTRNHANDGQTTDVDRSAKTTTADPTAAGKDATSEPAADKSQDETVDPKQADALAYKAGQSARAKSLSRKAIPAEYRQHESLMNSFLEGFDDGADKREPGEEG